MNAKTKKTIKDIENNFNETIYGDNSDINKFNKLTSGSLFLIQDLLSREKNALDVFRFQVACTMKDVKLSEQIKVYSNIDEKIAELDKACREINHCFEGQFPEKTTFSSTTT